MAKFLELRFGQGDLGRSITNRKDVDEGELFIQREIIPVKSIEDAYIVLPEKRNTRITYKHRGKLWSRTEYYRNPADCLRRWCMIRKACGMTFNDVTMNPVPLAMDAEEMKKGEEKSIEKDGKD